MRRSITIALCSLIAMGGCRNQADGELANESPGDAAAQVAPPANLDLPVDGDSPAEHTSPNNEAAELAGDDSHVANDHEDSSGEGGVLDGSLDNGDSAEDIVIDVSDGDPQINAAIARARATFPLFEARWKKIPADSVAVKIAVPTRGGGFEHIWFEPLVITKDTVTGICGNDPENVPGLLFGDRRTFKRSQVSDWMIVVGDTCYGGYTIQVLIKREPSAAPPWEFADLPTGN
ncbi:MAG: DUF2314 domain-containing protein [Pirellulaceae bacterium]|nr:DUF2314 domain-containing protein [Planctomycetales bacterium]